MHAISRVFVVNGKVRRHAARFSWQDGPSQHGAAIVVMGSCCDIWRRHGMTIQQLADIAARHLTRMADAMIAACVARALETGESLVVPERGAIASPMGARPTKRTDWERLVRGNSDTRRMHC